MKKSIGLIQISFKKQGGVIYRGQVCDSLKDGFGVESVDASPKVFRKSRALKTLEFVFNLLRLKGKKDLWIRDFFSVSFLRKKNTEGKNLALIFHIDFGGFPAFARIPLVIIEKTLFYRNLRKMDGIVVISKYWEEYFKKMGFKNVHKIYCAFDLQKFDISEQEVESFKQKNNLTGKPIIYIGNNQKAKGVVDSYNKLKDLDVHLVSSGRKETNVPVLNFNVSYREYLTLLKASDVAVLMSKFKEGWCMTAHEAMLLKTPVIGSGTGGMKELLEEGGQYVCGDLEQLKEKVEHLLKDPSAQKAAKEKGYEYAKQFGMGRFKEEWTNLVSKII